MKYLQNILGEFFESYDQNKLQANRESETMWSGKTNEVAIRMNMQN